MAHQALLLAGSTGVAQVLVAVLYLVAARGVTPSVFGSTVSAIALGTAAAGFLDFGTNNHWTRELAKRELSDRIFHDRMLSKVILTIFAAGIWMVVAAFLLPSTSYWLAGPIAVALVVNQSYQVPLRSAARGELVALVILADRVAASGLFFLLLACAVPAPTALWIALSAGSIAAAGVAKRIYQDHRPGPGFRFVNPWSGSQYFGLTSVSNSSQSLDLTLLSVVGGTAAAGVYGAVNRWTQPMALLAAAFASALAPYAARSESLRAAWHQFRRALWMPAAAVALAVGVFIMSPTIVDLLLGGAYDGSAATLRVLALVVIPSIVCQPLVVILQSFRRDRFVAIIMVVAALAQLVLVLFLGRSFGALGAAFSALIVQVFILVALVMATVRLRRTQEEAR